MKVTINNNDLDLNPDTILNASMNFSFFNGRKFSIDDESGTTHQVSLQLLMKAVKSEPRGNSHEMKKFRDAFIQLRDKGYSDDVLGNENCFVRLVAYILHYFSSKDYSKILKKINGQFNEDVLANWNANFDKIVEKHKKAGTHSRNDLAKHRISLYKETQKCSDKGFYVGDELVHLDSPLTKDMIENTQRYDNKMIPLSILPNPNHETIFEILDMDTLDLARTYQNEGLNPVALNLANAYQPGGGVEHGSGAQEESLFRRSNYFKALPSELYPIAGAQAIYSPNVQVFRTAEKNLTRTNEPDGYQFHEPYPVDMIACAGINLSNPSKFPSNFEELTRAKIRLILAIAVEKGHDSIVLGALGCGAFKNPPNKIAQYFREALETDEFIGRFKKVGFGIIFNEQLLQTFQAAFS